MLIRLVNSWVSLHQVSAVAFNKGKLKMLATAADSNLGGRDFDRLMALHFSNEFKSRYKVSLGYVTLS